MRSGLLLLCLFGVLISGLGCESDAIDPSREDPSEVAEPADDRPPEPEPAENQPSEIERAETVTDPLGDHVGDRYSASLETVLQKRFLRVLTSHNAFDFHLYRGERGGYQYEMVKAFTAFLNRKYPPERGVPEIQFELIPVYSDQLIPLLLEGAADLIAARMTVTPERAGRVRFSKPYRMVDEILVTHDETVSIDSLGELAGRTVAVRESSSYYESLLGFNRKLQAAGREPMYLERVDETLSTERILELVASRRFAYTVADSMVAALALAIYPQLRIVGGPPLRTKGELAWATQLPAATLAQEVNIFLERYEEGSLQGNIAFLKYFEAESRLAKRLADGRAAVLSDYDDLFKQHAAQFGLDWRLVAATAYQESRFDPTASNRWGATGLMQIKPKTAREPYIGIPEIEGTEHVSDNIRAGLKYLSWIKGRYFDIEPEMRERDRIRMALAAYNAGPRTLINARRRARKLGLDPNRWFRNVELALLDMRKVEPVKYVSEINQRYLAYVLLGLE